MVTLAGHAPPALAVLALWFVSTGVVVWLANRARTTFRRSLVGGSIVGVAGMALVAGTAHDGGTAAAYASFVGGLLVWAWHELAFLTGAVTGPRRAPSDPALRGWPRFAQASATVIHHEVALAATMVLLLAMTFGTANPTGAWAFALLFALRLIAKLNIFVGVPNFSDELLPAHLGYLRSYFRRRSFSWLLILSLVATFGFATWLGARLVALPPANGEAVTTSLLFALAALGALEHLFLALPFRDGAMWRWAVPAQARQMIRGGGYGL